MSAEISTHQGEDIPPQELQQRVLYSMLASVVRLSRLFGFGLKDLRSLMDTAYFQEMRDAGLTHREIAEALKVSERTAVKLSRQTREQFLEASVRHNLPRRIEFMLGAEPMGVGRICQLMPELEEALVRTALDELLAQGRVRHQPGRTLKFAPVAEARSLPRDTWMNRIGGLNTFVENFTNAVFGRFFAREPRTFARTLTFRGRPEVFTELERFYQEQVLPGLRAMHCAEGDESCDAEEVQVSLCWAPYEYLHTPGDNADDESQPRAVT